MESFKKLNIVLLLIFSTYALSAQVLITDEETPAAIDPSALVEMRSTSVSNPGGLLIPRVDFVLSSGEVILENMESPTDGLIVFNLGSNVEKGIWYYDGDEGRWIIFSNAFSAYSTGIDNFGEYYQYSSTGQNIQVYTSTWNPWSTSSHDASSMGSIFQTRDNEMVDVGGGTMRPADRLEVQVDGVFQISIASVFVRGITNTAFETTLFVNGTAVNKLRTITSLQSNGDYRSAAADGILELRAGDVIDLRFKAISASTTVVLYNLNWTLEKIGN